MLALCGKTFQPFSFEICQDDSVVGFVLKFIFSIIRRATWIACSVFLYVAVSVSAQQAAMELRHEVVKTWTTEQGLPQNFVTAITQTADGFLWVGTNGGLARFDGLQFKTFVHDGPSALRHAISALVVDKAGNLWIGSSAGLFSYHDGEFQLLPLGSGSPNPVEDIQRCRRGGCIWVRTKDGIFQVENGKARAVPVPLPLSHTFSITDDDEGKLWVADGRRVVVLRDGQIAAEYPLPNVRLLYTSSDGAIYAGDGHRLFRFGNGSFVRQPKEGAEEFVQVFIDSKQRLWMASGGLQGISRFADGKLEYLGTRQGLASNDARVLFEDRNGDMWVGTISGLQCIHRGKFVTFDAEDGLPPNSQYDSIFEDKAGTIWTGTLEAGVWNQVGDRWRNFGKREGIRSGQVRGFADGDTGPVVAVADYGLFALKDGRYRKMKGIPDGYVTSPVRTEDGSIWFSVLHKGVCRLRNGKLKTYGAAEGLTNDVIWVLAAQKNGSVWAGGRAGAFEWNGTRWMLAIPTTNGVDAITFPKAGGVLLGTSDGVQYRNGVVNWKMTQEDGLPGDAIFSLEEDDRGDLWMSTARGICRIPHEQLDALGNGKRPQITPEIFTEDDGLKSRTVLPLAQVTGLHARNGRIWYATVSGPAFAMPSMDLPTLPRAMLDSVMADDDYLTRGSWNVKPGRHRLVFAFTAPSFIAPEQVRFRYRLLGWKNDWVDAKGTREASFMGLSPGRYTFQVQASSRTGEWGPVSDGTSIELQPYFWQTRWFFSLVAIALVVMIVEVTRRRTLRRAESLNLRFQERAAERERIASQIHDTFIQDLTGTALQLEVLGFQLAEDPEIAQNSLSNLAARMRETIARSRDIVSNLHSMAGPEQGLLDLLALVEAEFRLTELPTYRLWSEGTPCPLHPFLRDEVYSICREAVANAFRHANARVIEVKVLFSAGKLVVTITDDGIGVSEEIRLSGRAGHFGLAGMQAHARRVGATLAVESASGSGTRVVLETPLPGRSRRFKRLDDVFKWFPIQHPQDSRHEEVTRGPKI